MSEKKHEATRWGRPHVFKDSIPFEIKWLSSDLVVKIDARKGKQTRRAYLEHLLRTHPELQEQTTAQSS